MSASEDTGLGYFKHAHKSIISQFFWFVKGEIEIMAKFLRCEQNLIVHFL